VTTVSWPVAVRHPAGGDEVREGILRVAPVIVALQVQRRIICRLNKRIVMMAANIPDRRFWGDGTQAAQNIRRFFFRNGIRKAKKSRCDEL
jgi:hypothetical protein